MTVENCHLYYLVEHYFVVLFSWRQKRANDIENGEALFFVQTLYVHTKYLTGSTPFNNYVHARPLIMLSVRVTRWFLASDTRVRELIAI